MGGVRLSQFFPARMVIILCIFVVGLVVVVAVVVINVGHKNLALKFGQNWVNDKLYIVVVLFIVLVLLLFLIQTPSFKTWSNSGH